MKEQFEEMMKKLIDHGGDAGGAYFSYPKGLKESVDAIKDALGLTEYRVVWTEKVADPYEFDLEQAISIYPRLEKINE